MALNTSCCFKSTWKFHDKLYSKFSSNPWSILWTLGWNWIAHVLYLSLCSCDALSCVQESKSELELFYGLFINLFCHILLVQGLRLFEQSLKLLLYIPVWFNAFQVLKCFFSSQGNLSQFCTCDPYWCLAGNPSSATESQKNYSKPP